MVKMRVWGKRVVVRVAERLRSGEVAGERGVGGGGAAPWRDAMSAKASKRSLSSTSSSRGGGSGSCRAIPPPISLLPCSRNSLSSESGPAAAAATCVCSRFTVVGSTAPSLASGMPRADLGTPAACSSGIVASPSAGGAPRMYASPAASAKPAPCLNHASPALSSATGPRAALAVSASAGGGAISNASMSAASLSSLARCSASMVAS